MFATDYDNDGSMDILVGASDGTVRLYSGGSATQALDIEYEQTPGTDFTYEFNLPIINDRPISITLDQATVSENQPGAILGTLTVSDPDLGDSHQLMVSDSRFELVGSELRLKAENSLDHEAEPNVEIEITATDLGGLSLTETLMIQVIDVNEAPSISGLIDIQLMEDESFDAGSGSTGEVGVSAGLGALGFR